MFKKNKKEDIKTLAKNEELFIAVAHNISLEDHQWLDFCRTLDKKDFDIFIEVGKIRRTLLKEIVGDVGGQRYCFLKHACGEFYRLSEAASKSDFEGAKEKAKKAYILYKLFWVLLGREH